MESNISTPANQGVSGAEKMRRYHQMIGSPHANDVTSCPCELSERPDNWSDDSWQKYKLIMARLSCKTCGWAGGSEFAMHSPGLFVPKESVRVPASNRKKPEGKAGRHRGYHDGKPEYRVGCFHLLVHLDIRGLGLRFWAGRKRWRETDHILVIYEM